METFSEVCHLTFTWLACGPGRVSPLLLLAFLVYWLSEAQWPVCSLHTLFYKISWDVSCQSMRTFCGFFPSSVRDSMEPCFSWL